MAATDAHPIWRLVDERRVLQSRLARELGIGQPHISELRHGRRRLLPRHRAGLVAALERLGIYNPMTRAPYTEAELFADGAHDHGPSIPPAGRGVSPASVK